MSFEAGSIFYTIKADTSALLTADKEVSDFNKRAQEGFEKTSAAMSKLTNIAKAVSAALVSSKVISYAQSWNELEDRIQNTGATAAQTKDILEQLLLTSNRNGRTIEESSELYINLSNSMKELGYSTQGTLNYIDTLSNLFTINKTKSLEAESAINALTKAQTKGKLSGLEALTVFKAMPSILKTLSNQLKKNAKTTAEADKITEGYVRRLASEGKLSMKMFTNAMIEAQAETAALANNMRNTIQDGLTRITNNLKKYCGELNNSMGATKLIVDSLILMSEHVNILMTSVGALAAIYAGRYITSLANATKQSVEKTIADIRQAQAEKVLIQAEIERINQNISSLQIQKQNIIMAQVHCNSLKAQTALNKQLAVVEKQLATAANEHTAAQARINAAMKASSFAANGLRSAMALLGGPAGILFLAAGALMMWSNNAEEAKRKALSFADSIDDVNESLKELTVNQLNTKIDEVEDGLSLIETQAKKTAAKLNHLEILASDPFNRLDTEYGTSQGFEKLNREIRDLKSELDKLSQSKDKLNSKLQRYTAALGVATGETNNSSKEIKSLDDALKQVGENKIDDKVKSLSTQLEIAEMKLNDSKRSAYIYENVLNELGTTGEEYKGILKELILDSTKWANVSDDARKKLEPLFIAFGKVFDANEKLNSGNKDGKDAAKSYAEEVKELQDKLEIAKLEAKGFTVEAELLTITQKMGSKVTAQQTAELKKLIEASQAYKALGSLKSPIDAENDSFKQSKESLDKLYKLGELKQTDYYSKLERLEKEHQINLAKIKSDAVVSKVDDAVAQVDPVQALENEHKRKLALIQEFEREKSMSEQTAIALREAANQQYEQNRINAQWEIWRNQSDANEFLASSLEGLANSATSTISGLVSGTMTATQAMQNFANVILNEAIGSLVQMGMQYVKNSIVAQSTSAATTATQITAAEALAIAYQPAAMLASIATQGSAATIGAESYMTALGAMKAYTIAGAREHGGPVAANSMYRVGEGNKPEILMQGGRQYLIPGENGQVLSNRQINSDNGNNIQWNFIVQNYASNVEISQPSINERDKTVTLTARLVKKELTGEVTEHRGEFWHALNSSTNIHPKL